MKIAVRGTRLFVDVVGAATRWENGKLRHAPPLFLLHGGPGSNHVPMRRGLDFLSEWFQLFYVDHRGCGFSDRVPARQLTIVNNAEDLEALRRKLGFEKISILGSSYGGMVATKYAARYPRHIELLFMVGTAGSGDFIAKAREYLARHGTPEQNHAAERLWRGAFRTQQQIGYFFKTLEPMYWHNPRPAPAAGVPPINLTALNQGFRDELPKWNDLPGLRRVTAPALITVGRYDWICPVSQSEALHRQLRNSTLKIYDACAHIPQMDQAKRFQKDCAAFIRRHL